MNAVIPAATARRLMASMLAKTLATARYAATAVMVETRREECTVGKIQVNDPIRPRELTMIRGEQITIPVLEFRTHLQFHRFAGCPGCNLHLRSIAKRHDEILGADLREVVVFYSSARAIKPHTLPRKGPSI